MKNNLNKEHLVLLKHFAKVQNTVTQQCSAQQNKCDQLEAKIIMLNARWIIATSQMLFGLGWPTVPTKLERRSEDEKSNLQNVLCNTGCISHAHAWLDNQGNCKLDGQGCARTNLTVDAK